MNKDALRVMARDKRNAINPDQRLRDEAQLATHIRDVLGHLGKLNGLIGLYVPVKSEIKLPTDFDKTALPVARQDKILEYYPWTQGEELVVRDFNIPIPDTRHKSPVIPDVILAPLLMCDRKGNRLGQGKGHYDRYFASLSHKPLYIGVCFEEQLYDGILPAEPHDARLDIVITPKQVINIA